MTEEIKQKRDYLAWKYEPAYDSSILDHYKHGFDAALELAQAEIERLALDSIHTCHNQCRRLACVQRREIEKLKSEINRLNEKYDFQTLVKTNERLTKENEELKADSKMLIEALEHYQTSHWTFEGSPCFHDRTAKKTITEWNKKRGGV